MNYTKLPFYMGLVWYSVLAFFVDVFYLTYLGIFPTNFRAKIIRAHAECHTFLYYTALLELLNNPGDKKALRSVAKTQYRLIIMMSAFTTYSPHLRPRFPDELAKLYAFRDLEIKTHIKPLK